MNMQIYTDFSTQTASSKSKPTKSEEATGSTTFSGELKKRLDEAKRTQPSPDKGIDREGKSDSNDPLQAKKTVTDETENTQSQAEAAMQIVTLFATMVPITVPDKPLVTQTGSLSQQVAPDITVSAAPLPNTVAVLQTASQQEAEPAASLFSVEMNEESLLPHPDQQKPSTETPRDSSGLEMENALSTQPKLQISQSKPNSSDTESKAAADSEKTAQKPENELKPQLADGQLNAFAQRIDDAGLTIQSLTAKAQPDTPPTTQVATAVLEAYQNGKTEFTMKLEPESLGELTVKLVYEQGKVSLSILTANDQTTKLIGAQMAELKTALKQSNIQIETCSVENQSFNNLASGGQFSMQSGRQQQRPEHTQRLIIQRLPCAAEDSLSPLTVLGATSILNCYV